MKKNKNNVVSGLFWSYGERFFTKLVSLVVSIILARLLTPENYGIISIVMIFISLCDAIIAGGFEKAFIQKKDADELDADTMFCCSMAVSVLLYSVLFFGAPFIARFYQEDVICPILRVLGLHLVISSVHNLLAAWIQKQMLFRKFFIASFFGTMLSAVIGIGLAYFGAGPWALVAQYLTNIFVDTVVLLFTNDWRPRFRFSYARAKALLSYGSKVFLTTIVFTLESHMRSLLIGKKFGSADLAYYDQGNRFPSLLVSDIYASLVSVIFPVFSQLQDKLQQLKQTFRQTIRIGVYFLAPLLIGLIAVSDNFIGAILTDKWMPCVPYLQILTLIYLPRPFSSTCQQAILSVGRSDIYLKIISTTTVVSLVTLIHAAFVLESVLWVALGRLFAEFVSLALFSHYTKKVFAYSLKEQLRDILPGYLLAGIMGLLTSCIPLLCGSYWLTLMVQILFGVTFYILASWLLQINSFVSLIRMMCEKIPDSKVKTILRKLIRTK